MMGANIEGLARSTKRNRRSCEIFSESNFVIGENTGSPNYVRVRWTFNLSGDF